MKNVLLFIVLFVGLLSVKPNMSKADEYYRLADKFLTEGLLINEDEGLTKKQKLQKLIDKYIGSMDLAWNAKMALGRPYQKLSKEEQKEYIDEYSRYVAYVWLPKFNFNRKNGVKITVLEKTQKINDTDANVKMVVEDPNASKYDVVIRTRITKDGEFKLLNMSVEGIDLANSYRAQFTSYIEQHNNDPRSIIEYLKKQNKIQKAKALFTVNLKK